MKIRLQAATSQQRRGSRARCGHFGGDREISPLIAIIRGAKSPARGLRA